MSDVNLDRFLAICGPADEDVAALVAFFIPYMTDQLAALRAAGDDRRVHDVELIAHRLAGSCGTYGFEPLVGPFAAIEREARDGSLRDLAARAREAEAVFATIESALRDLAARRSQP